MVCVRLPAVKFKRRVQATVWAGAFVRFAAFEVAGRLLGVLGHAGAVAAPAIRHFENSNGWGNPNFETFDRFDFGLAPRVIRKPLGLFDFGLLVCLISA